MENPWISQLKSAKPIPIDSSPGAPVRRLIRRFLAMLMQPVRLHLLESDVMMEGFFWAPKNPGKIGKSWENDGKIGRENDEL